jgi:hypothetical protein
MNLRKAAQGRRTAALGLRDGGRRHLGSGTAWPALSSETGTATLRLGDGVAQYQPGGATSVSATGELGFLLEPVRPFIL